MMEGVWGKMKQEEPTSLGSWKPAESMLACAPSTCLFPSKTWRPLYSYTLTSFFFFPYQLLSCHHPSLRLDSWSWFLPIEPRTFRLSTHLQPNQFIDSVLRFWLDTSRLESCLFHGPVRSDMAWKPLECVSRDTGILSRKLKDIGGVFVSFPS